jgi:hypothetical protein
MAAEPKTKTLGRGSDSTSVRLGGFTSSVRFNGFTSSVLFKLGMTGATSYIRIESMIC